MATILVTNAIYTLGKSIRKCRSGGIATTEAKQEVGVPHIMQ
jgi:hypothetical protein